MSSVHTRAATGARASAAARQQSTHKERFSLENEMPRVFKGCLRLLDSSNPVAEDITILRALRDDLREKEAKGMWFSSTTYQLLQTLNVFLRRH